MPCAWRPASLNGPDTRSSCVGGERSIARWVSTCLTPAIFHPGGGAYRHADREKKEQIARQIPALLNATLHQVVAVTFRRDEFWRVAGDRWRARYGPSLYSAAVQLCLGCISRWADERRYTGTIAYKIEAGEEDQAYAYYAETLFVTKRPPRGDFAALVLADTKKYRVHKFTDDMVPRLVEEILAKPVISALGTTRRR